MNESQSVENFISLNESKSLSIHQAALNSIFMFSELKEDPANEKSAIHKNIEEIQTLIAQLEHEQQQCSLLSQEIELKKQSYYRCKAEVELFIIKEEENEKKSNQQQERQYEQLSRTAKLISGTREMLKSREVVVEAKRVPLRKVF